jgi:sugar phosphate isomerase/epimerase
MHPGQAVYNPRTLLRLRDIAGPALAVNMDPSHLFYQGMDPLVVVRALGELIVHTHVKDAQINQGEMALNGGLETLPVPRATERSWNYRTLGYGHSAGWWCDFVSALRIMGYDGVLSIEHEDVLMSVREGIEKSVEFLQPIVLRTMPEESAPWLEG